MQSQQSEVTFAQVRRLAKRLGSRRDSVRLAAEAELRAIGPAAAECWAAHVREDRHLSAERARASRLGCVMSTIALGLAVAIGIPMLIVLVSIAIFVPLSRVAWRNHLSRPLSDDDALRLCLAVDNPRALVPLLLALGKLGWGIRGDLAWAACDKAVTYFDALSDNDAAHIITSHHIVTSALLLKAYITGHRKRPGSLTVRASRLISLVRRTEETRVLADLERLTERGGNPVERRPLEEAALECAQHLREVWEQRRRNELLLRPAAAPADETLLRPAQGPRDAEPDVLLRPGEPEESP
jgi:hypothetical protein